MIKNNDYNDYDYDVDNDDGNDDFEEILVTLKLKKNVAQVLRLLAKHYDEGDVDKFLSEEVSKIIFAIAESSSTFIPSMSDELKQHTQKLKLLEQQEEEKESEKKNEMEDLK